MYSNFSCDTDVRIERDFSGCVEAHRVLIASGARFVGTLRCNLIIILGFADADISCKSCVILGNEAILVGRVRYVSLQISQGAFVTATLLRRCQPSLLVTFLQFIHRCFSFDRLVLGNTIRALERL